MNSKCTNEARHNILNEKHAAERIQKNGQLRAIVDRVLFDEDKENYWVDCMSGNEAYALLHMKRWKNENITHNLCKVQFMLCVDNFRAIQDDSVCLTPRNNHGVFKNIIFILSVHGTGTKQYTLRLEEIPRFELNEHLQASNISLHDIHLNTVKYQQNNHMGAECSVNCYNGSTIEFEISFKFELNFQNKL